LYSIEAKFIAEDWDPIEYVFPLLRSSESIPTRLCDLNSFEDDEWIEHELVDSHKKLTPAGKFFTFEGVDRLSLTSFVSHRLEILSRRAHYGSRRYSTVST